MLLCWGKEVGLFLFLEVSFLLLVGNWVDLLKPKGFEKR